LARVTKIEILRQRHGVRIQATSKGFTKPESSRRGFAAIVSHFSVARFLFKWTGAPKDIFDAI
jgi:hypothetical protein